jgi:preprotein translocase subunit SecD
MTTQPSFTKLMLRLAPALLLAACGPNWQAGKRAERAACSDPAATSRVNFHMVVERQSADPYPGADIFHDPAGASITIRRKVAISGQHVLRVIPSFDGSSPALALQLDSEGAAQLAKVTGAAGESGRIALVVDGAPVAAARFQGPVATRAILIGTALPPKETEALAQRIEAALPDCVAPANTSPKS